MVPVGMSFETGILFELGWIESEKTLLWSDSVFLYMNGTSILIAFAFHRVFKLSQSCLEGSLGVTENDVMRTTLWSTLSCGITRM